jgi:hypothetical protein
VLGCVLNMQPAKQAEGRGRYDGYGYYEDAPAAKGSVVDVGDLLDADPGVHDANGQAHLDTAVIARPDTSNKAELADTAQSGSDSQPGDAEGWQAIHVTKTRGTRRNTP